MTIPYFRFGGYMNATSGGTNSSASSGYGGSGSGSGGSGGGGGGSSGGSSAPPPGSGPHGGGGRPHGGSGSGGQSGGSGTSSVGQTIYNNTVKNEDGLTQDEINKIKAQNQAANEAAYEASKARQEELRKAIAFMQSQQSNQSGQINLDNIDNKKLEEIAKTGLFAMEASGDLGGTFGAEIEANKLKYALANAQTNEEAAAIRATMEKMGYSNVSQYDPFTAEGKSNPNYNPNLGFDPTGVLSFGDVESDPNLKFSYYGLQNKNASADQIRQFLPNVYGYKSSGLGGLGGGGGYGGYGGYGSGGGGGGGGFSYDMGMQGQPQQRGQVGPGGLQEQVNQAFLSGGKPFAKGGIVSLVEN